MVKNLPAMQETWVSSLAWENTLEKEMATHFSILDWRVPWKEEPRILQFVGYTHTHACTHVYMWYHIIFVFLFLTYFTEYNNLYVHPCSCKWHYSSLLWLGCIPLYRCISLLYRIMLTICYLDRQRTVQKDILRHQLGISKMCIMTGIIRMKILVGSK